MHENQTFGVDSEDDSDDYDIAEANCELAMVQGQLCNIPYELYDLPQLTGILSVETWNSFLTEEERFFLSCFLPDMDQETFSLMMQELLGGANFYFGNPVDKLYMKLRGGLFAPKVACYNEGVIFLKRKMYYYSLKFHHQKLINTFTEMQRLWNQYGKEMGKNTRLLLWSERRQTSNLKLLDLNRIPSVEIDNAACRFTTPNVMKPVERNRTKSLTFTRSGISKRTLKITKTKQGILRYQGSSLVTSGHHHQTLPKGPLKIVAKSSPTTVREPYVAPGNNLQQTHETCSSNNRFAASPYSGMSFGKPYTELSKCLVKHQDTYFTYLETTQSSIDKTEPVLHDPTSTIPRGFGTSNDSFTERNLSTKPTKQEEYVHCHLKSPDFNRGIVYRRSSETTETKGNLSGKNFQREDKVQRKPLRVLSEGNQTGDDNLFPLTYKRRKVQRLGVS